MNADSILSYRKKNIEQFCFLRNTDTEARYMKILCYLCFIVCLLYWVQSYRYQFFKNLVSTHERDTVFSAGQNVPGYTMRSMPVKGCFVKMALFSLSVIVMHLHYLSSSLSQIEGIKEDFMNFDITR